MAMHSALGCFKKGHFICFYCCLLRKAHLSDIPPKPRTDLLHLHVRVVERNGGK